MRQRRYASAHESPGLDFGQHGLARRHSPPVRTQQRRTTPHRRCINAHRSTFLAPPRIGRKAVTHQFCLGRRHPGADRKSTRLNSSHLVISYAVFCLKKKNKRSRHYTLLRLHSTTTTSSSTT